MSAAAVDRVMNPVLDLSPYNIGDPVSLICTMRNWDCTQVPTIQSTAARLHPSYKDCVKVYYDVPLYGVVVGSWVENYQVRAMFGVTETRQVASIAIMTTSGVVMVYDGAIGLGITKEYDGVDQQSTWP